MSGDVRLNRSDEVAHVAETATANALVRQLAEPPLHHVQPRTRCRNEVEMEAWMPPEPGRDTWVRMGPVVVHDQVQVEMGQRLGVDLLEESDELLVPMPRHAITDDGPIEHAQRREQSGGAMAFVVMRHRAAAASLQRQARLCAIESLNLAFLVDGEHQGPIRGIEIEADHVVELLDELFVATDLERPNKMGLEAMLLPDAAHCGFADPVHVGHGPSAPMGRGGRLRVQSRLNNGADLLCRNARDAARAWSIVLEARDPQGQKPLAPQLHGRPRDTQLPRDVLTQHAVSRHGDDPGALHHAQGHASCVSPRGQRRALFQGQDNGRSKVHDA